MGVDNLIHQNGTQLFRKVTLPASGGTAGGPCLVGTRPGVMITDQDANGYATVKFTGVFLLSVKGVNSGGASAVAVNDRLYFNNGATPKINKDSGGTAFGWASSDEAMSGVGSNATADIYVDLG